MIKNIYLALLVSYIFSYQGELISYDFIESFDKDEIQMILDNEFGYLAPDGIYNVSMY